MPDTGYIIAAVALAAVITFALRALPFAVIEPLRSSRLAGELAVRMPGGLMLILVVYLLRDVPTSRRRPQRRPWRLRLSSSSSICGAPAPY